MGKDQVTRDTGFTEKKFTPVAIVPKKYPGMLEARNISVAQGKEVYGPKEEWQGKGDALRHIVWQALVAKSWNPTVANLLGQYHELPITGYLGGAALDQTPQEKQQDLFNNALGRDIAAKANSIEDIYRLAKEAVDTGKAQYVPLAEIERQVRAKELQDELDQQNNPY